MLAWTRSILIAAAAALPPAALRAAAAALRDGFAQAGRFDLAARAAAQVFASSFPPALLAALLLVLLVRRRPVRAAFAVAVALPFAGGLLPDLGVRTPDPWSSKGRLVLAAAALASALAALLLARADRRPRFAGATGALAFVLLAVSLFEGAGAERRADADRRPNVIVLSLDTLRADRLGCYGSTLGATPHLDAFAREATVFDRAYTPQPWTLTAHMTLLTGLSPTAHGLDADRTLSPRARTLAERFRAAGYATAAVVDKVVWLKEHYGFARGFDVYRRTGGDAARKVREARTLLDVLGAGPFFLFLHVFDAHSDWRRLPYESDPEDRERFASWYDGPFDGCIDGLGCASRLLQRLFAGEGRLGEREQRYIASLYDAGVASLDRRLGTFFAALRETGRLDDTVVVVLADHGEELFDHGKPLHGRLFEEVARVPLIVRAPGLPGGHRIARPVGLADVAPTLAEHCGLEAGGFEGESFLDALRGGAAAGRGRGYTWFDLGEGRVGLTDGRLKILPGRRPVLYDLESDPGERSPFHVDEVPEALRGHAARLLDERDALIERFLKDADRLGSLSGRELNEEERRALEALGYVGGH